jgi:hypothetical protein
MMMKKGALVVLAMLLQSHAFAISVAGRAAVAARPAPARATVAAKPVPAAKSVTPEVRPAPVPFIVPARGVSTNTCKDANGERCK